MKRALIIDHHAIHAAGRELYRQLAATGEFEIRVIVPRVWKEYGVTTGFEPPPTSRLTLDGDHTGPEAFTVVPSAVLFGGKTHRNLYCALSRELRSIDPDILLVNSEPEGFLAAQAVWLNRRHHLKTALVFTTWRNMDYGRPDEPFPVKWPWLSRWIESYVLPCTTHVVAHSPSAPRIFESKGFSDITYIPPWVDVKRFSGRTNLDVGVLQVGFVGRLVPEKGVDVLVRALRNLDVPVHLTVIGEGPEKTNLEHLVRESGLSEQCTFLPVVPHGAIPEVMRGFDVLVLPSRARRGWKEQFGRVLIEAMASRVAVVGSDSGDIPQVIGDAGFIFREGDVEGLHAILKRLASDRSLRQTRAEAGFRRVTEEYSLDVAVRRYRNLLISLKFKPEIRRIQERPSQQNQA
jgi:glycosyltransferase involved in cell wall biosynthesis